MISTFVMSLKSAAANLASFTRENRGSVSVEFAFIMPLLITLWLGTMEISEGIEVNKKLGRMAAMTSDLLTTEKDITQDGLKDILNISNSQLLPYARSTPKTTVVGVNIDAAGNATVAWSMEKNGSQFKVPLKKGNAYTLLPAKVKLPSSFVVTVTTTLEFLPITSWSIQKNKGSGDSAYAAVDMEETYYFQARQGEVKCDTCSANPTNL